MNKQEFKANAKNTIDDLFAQYEKMETKVKEMKGEIRKETREKLNDLKQEKEELSTRFDRLKNSSEENWNTMKEAVSSGIEAFKRKLNQ